MSQKTGAELLQLISEYKRLDKRRDQLSPLEKKRLDELSLDLESILDRNAKGKKPRRESLRVNCSRGIEIETTSDLKKLYLENISGGGIYVATDNFMKVGEHLELKIFIKDKGLTRKLSGVIAWVNTKNIEGLPPGMGIKFENLSSEEKDFVKEIVHSQLDNLGKKKP